MIGAPFKSGQIFKLTNLGIDPKFFKFNVTHLESERYVCIRDVDQTNTPQLSIVEIFNKMNVVRRPGNKVDGAIMHIKDNIIALKAPNEGKGHILQIFDMDKKAKLKNIEFNENIVFWKWVNEQILAIVTTTSVYHVSIANETDKEVKVFERSGDLVAAQIIGYVLSDDRKWSALFGISTPDQGKTINGHIQLYFIEGQKQQMIEGHACTFGTAFIHNETHRSNIFCFVERKAGQNTASVHISEISAPPEGCQKHKLKTEIVYDPSTPNDFPISLVIAQKYGMLYIITKFGFVYIYELTTNQQIFKTRISNQPIFVAARNFANDGILAINKDGSLLGGMIDENGLLPHLLNSCGHIPNVQQLAFTIAGRYNLPGVDNIFLGQFNNFLINGDYQNAAKIASMSPGTLLRNEQTIQKFKSLPQMPGQPQALLIYFQKLLERGKLNKLETLELCGPVVAQGKIDLVRNWVNGNKLQPCVELGDMVGKLDKTLALKIYQDGKLHDKVVAIFNEMGRVDEAMKYAQQNGVQVNVAESLRSMIDMNPEGALQYAKSLYQKDRNINVREIADMFLQRNRIQEYTSLLFDCMRDNKPEDANYQTKVLEVNIMIAPQIAESIMQMKIWNQYNRPKIAALCEQKGMYQRALENYTELKDIKRVLLNSHVLPPDFIGEYLGKMSPQSCIECMGEMLKFNRQNIQIVVNVSIQHLAKLGAGNIVKMFESVGSFEGIFFFLGTVINSTNDKEVHHKYIEAAAKVGQLRAIEEIIKNKVDCYDPIKVKNTLLELKLTDPKPIIYLCDAHQQFEELTKYLYKNNFSKYIEVYLFKVCKNPKAIPVVLGTLIDLECDQGYIKQILKTVRASVPMEELVSEFERRSKLSILENWLEERCAENIQIPAIHNAMAKIKIDTNQNPQQFLLNNKFYDAKVVGKFCEDRDPHLAVLAYRRNLGECDQQMIECTNKNSLYRIQAQYLVNRQSKELWQSVLRADNEHRKEIIDQVVSTALPESKNPEEVIRTVEAFMEAELTTQLMILLEKIVLHNSDFAKYKKLQNLLIITAIKSDQSRVMDYINRLDNYDAIEIAKIAMDPKYGLFEEAFTIYKKQNMHSEALDILIQNLGDLHRAEDYAEKVNQPEVWSKLGVTYLNNMRVTNAMEAFMKCKDHTYYLRVIGLMDNEQESEQKDFKYPLYIKYLLMVREATKDVNIDNSLTFSYARLDKLTDLENFLSGTNSADCQKVGDKCYAAGLYEAAKKFYTIVKNNSKIASCLVKLKEYGQAIEAAKKANTPKTWKEVCMACVAAQEYKLASAAAMNIIIHPDELEGLIRHYESLGVTNQMISVLETGAGLERAHVGIFTELAILYAKYRPEKLMEHCKTYVSKLNTSKLLRACQKFMLWKEAVYLYSHYNEFDQAINIMIDHSPTAFNHETYLQLIVKVSNNDLYYKSINFYLEEQPLLVNELLKTLANKIDLVKCTNVLRRLNIVQLVQPFLKIVQQTNTKEVNEALNELYLQTENYEELRESIEHFGNFDSYNLAKATENHELLQFRRISAYLFRKNGKYEQSIALSKKDEMYKDAIDTARESDNVKIVEDLLKFFVERKEKEFFAATLYTCYEYVRPDLVLEYAWRFGMYEFAMPYMIQLVSELKTRVETVHKKTEDRQKKEEQQAKEKMNQPLDFVANDLDLMMPGSQLMLTGGAPIQGGMFGSMNPGMNPGMNPMMPGQFGTQPGPYGSTYGKPF